MNSTDTMTTYAIFETLSLSGLLILIVIGMAWFLIAKLQLSNDAIVITGAVLSGLLVSGILAVNPSSVQMAKMRDDISLRAYDYHQEHPNEKRVIIDNEKRDVSNLTPGERLLDAPDAKKVTKVFYIDGSTIRGRVVSGDKSDYRDAVLSDHLVYVFTTK